MTWSANKVVLLVVHVAAITILMAGLALSTTALVSPRWHVIEIERKSETHTYGLWELCVQSVDHTGRTSTNCEDLDMGTTTGNKNVDAANRWRVAVLSLVSAGSLFTFIALVLCLSLSCVYCDGYRACMRTLAVTCLVFAFLATALMAAGVVIFLRKYRDLSRTSSLFSPIEYLGISYWLAVAACLSLGLASILTFLCAILVFVTTNQQSWNVISTFDNGIVV